jgi:hypothetical protein
MGVAAGITRAFFASRGPPCNFFYCLIILYKIHLYFIEAGSQYIRHRPWKGERGRRKFNAGNLTELCGAVSL